MNTPAQTECRRRRPFGWLSGNIRRKLTLFVVVILLMVVGMFWFCSVYMLQPAYQRSITADLTAALNTVTAILDGIHAEGGQVLKRPVPMQEADLSDETYVRLNAALAAGSLNLDNRCLDIAGTDLRSLLLQDNLEPGCNLHPSYETGITPNGNEVTYRLNANSDYVTLVRKAVFSSTGGYTAVESGQIIMGRTAAGGAVSVTVAANLERIPQAVGVLKTLLFPLSILLAVFSAFAAWVFSHWFTRPLSRLSEAAREMAKGHYGVRVRQDGDDEIAELARDFNVMAYEVGRSADLQRELLANVSHDLRTPLTLIKGYAETVRDLTGDDKLKRVEQLNVIVDESDRLSALVGRVMELSRMSSGAERPEPLRFDLYDLCDELAYRYDELCRRKGNTFMFSGEEGCTILADPSLVERALHNLLGNAIGHVGADGFVGLKVRKTAEGTVRCEVSDHGQGIDEKDLPHIFERYYRSRADAGKTGTGLGLPITKAIFEAQAIRYGVVTEWGMGTTFWFELPFSVK